MQTMTGKRLFVAGVIVIVVGSILTGLYLSGSPEEERALRFDQQRVNDLQQISSAIDSYWNLNQRQTLPDSLAQLQSDRNVYINSIADPKTGAAYEYRTISTTSYELCATFERNTPTTTNTAPQPYPGNQFWQHGTGRACFTINVNIVPGAPVPGKPVPIIK